MASKRLKTLFIISWTLTSQLLTLECTTTHSDAVPEIGVNWSRAEMTYLKIVPCLKNSRLLREDVQFKYPVDAEKHYLDVLQKTAKYRHNITMHEAAGTIVWFNPIKWENKRISFGYCKALKVLG